MSLENQATFHAFWPNTDSPDLTSEEHQAFLDREQTLTRTFTLKVDPSLQENADVLPPWGMITSPREWTSGADVPLSIQATEDARWMYLREWALDPINGDWIVKQNSGWIDYSPEHTWTLSEGQGVKFIGLWLEDSAGNVSTLSEVSLTFVNRMDGPRVLADGERVQYLGLLQGGEIVHTILKTVSGDPDAYLWKPRNAFWPDRFSQETVPPGVIEESGMLKIPEDGRYLLEVGAVGESEYELILSGEELQLQSSARTMTLKTLPPHPLTVSDPLSSGQTGMAPNPIFLVYLPLITK